MWTKKFWMDATERAAKTFAQTVISLVAVAAPIAGFGLLEVNWLQVLAVGAIASAISILTSLASTLVGKKDSASLVE